MAGMLSACKLKNGCVSSVKAASDAEVNDIHVRNILYILLNSLKTNGVPDTFLANIGAHFIFI